MNEYEGMCLSGGKFLKECQVTDKIIEWTFFQFTFNLLQMTQTQEIIYHRVSKIHEWIWGDVMCMSGENFLKEWQVTDEIIEWIVFQFTFNLLQMIQSQEIITFRVSKIQKWIWGDVYEWHKVFYGMTSDRKNYRVNCFPIHIQPFMNDSNSRNNQS